MTLRSIAWAIWYQDTRLASTMIANTDLAALHLRVQNGNVPLIDPALSDTNTALIEERKARAAARSRAACAESNTQLGDRWRRKARHEGRR
eukprot:3548579-Pyramimonas_sp.AAC.1